MNKVIFEIGPISDYLASTRKLKDLWGGSFLFSYLMGKVAHMVLENEDGSKPINEIIKRPRLAGNELFEAIRKGKIEDIQAGSIPDRLFCIVSNKETPEKVKNSFVLFLRDLFDDCAKELSGKNKGDQSLIFNQLKNYFRLFYVIADDSTADFLELEKAISMRSELYEFSEPVDQFNKTETKDEKCSLCGDRKKVITLARARRGNRDENLCAVCTIKRGMINIFQKKVAERKFMSTTDVAAIVVKEILANNFDQLGDDVFSFAKLHYDADDSIYAKEVVDEFDYKEMAQLMETVNNSDKKVIEKISYQLFFTDLPECRNFKEKIRDSIKGVDDPDGFKDIQTKLSLQGTKYKLMPWISQAFFSIVALDGDNMGKILSDCEKGDNAAELSKAILKFTENTADIIKRVHGKLIFCGGEDIIAIVHPLVLMQVVHELNDKFIENIKPFYQNPSLSAGAVICHHKYPLSLAVKEADEMLTRKAKKMAGKGAIAVKLIKGGSEGRILKCKINDSNKFDINAFNDLIGCGVSRSFVYKIVEESNILEKTLLTTKDLNDYIKFLYGKTRERKIDDKYPQALQKLVELSVMANEQNGIKPDLQAIIDRLYFARFLEGGE